MRAAETGVSEERILHRSSLNARQPVRGGNIHPEVQVCAVIRVGPTCIGHALPTQPKIHSTERWDRLPVQLKRRRD